MKKVFFAVAVLAATALVSCNNKTAEATENAADSAEVVEGVVEETLVVETPDSTAAAPADSTAAPADSTVNK